MLLRGDKIQDMQIGDRNRTEDMTEFDDMLEDVDRFLNRMFDVSGLRRLPSPDGWHPPTDLYETPRGYLLIIDLAGMERKDIQVRVVSGHLIISGVRRLPIPADVTGCHNLEISSGSFQRVLVINDIPDNEKIEARYRAGFLIIELPKTRGRECRR